jgi:hypothetical protein
VSGFFAYAIAAHWHAVLEPGYLRTELKRMINRARDMQVFVEVPKKDIMRINRDLEWYFN